MREELRLKLDRDDEANEARCLASDIIVSLYEARQLSQLQLLKAQIIRTVEAIESGK